MQCCQGSPRSGLQGLGDVHDLQEELSWDMFPPVTEREMALPWYHERFRLREGPDGPYMTDLGDKRSAEDRERAEASDASDQDFYEEGDLDDQAASRDTGEEDAEAVELEGPLARALAVSNLLIRQPPVLIYLQDPDYSSSMLTISAFQAVSTFPVQTLSTCFRWCLQHKER